MSSAKVLQAGDANADQLRVVLRVSRQCFDSNRIDTTHGVGQLEGTLGGAVGCVEHGLANAWGFTPSIPTYGSASCGQCDGYGLGSTVIEVQTDSGNWLFVLQLEGAQATTKPASASGHAIALQQGDATQEQLADVLRASDDCFARHQIDTSNIGQLEGTLGVAVGCVQGECEGKWGYRPRVSNSGSHSCGQCDGYGLGATIIAVDGAASGDWMFVMRLK